MEVGTASVTLVSFDCDFNIKSEQPLSSPNKSCEEIIAPEHRLDPRLARVSRDRGRPGLLCRYGS